MSRTSPISSKLPWVLLLLVVLWILLRSLLVLLMMILPCSILLLLALDIFTLLVFPKLVLFLKFKRKWSELTSLLRMLLVVMMAIALARLSWGGVQKIAEVGGEK